MKSWKTTVSGICAALAAVANALKSQFDSNPDTTPDWGIVIACLVTAVGLLNARDKNVSSEQQGIK